MKDSRIHMLCMENVIMRLRCPTKHPFLVNHALGAMFNPFVFKWNGFTIPTWLAYGTEHMQLRMQCEFSCFFFFCFCFVEENARMSKHENKWYAILQTKKFVERICMMMPWLMQNVRLEYDNGQMQERYVHYDVMKRCLCDAWYECILRTREPGKLSLLTCAFGGAVPHVYN